MFNNFSDKQKYIIIAILIGLLILILIAFFAINKKSSTGLDPSESNQDSTIGFTGYSDVETPEDDLKKINQNRDLRKLSPYTGNGFKIVYSYDTFKYEVYVSPPYDQSRTNFNTFIDANYPNIPDEKFIFIEDNQDQAKEKDTDHYVAKNTPYESSTFSVRSEYGPQPPAHFFFIVTKKITDEEKVKQDVDLWLQQLDLSQEQIDGLDIRYE
ncbi:hypothetical protein A3F59_05310 [Candidatus Roizmanbacteria bacterium RIFCSPHIGHO2_12_FULL_38_13]|nr:MAG: hypothetical protein A3F59_05310 [Candidatus Roizmanbacteria bacterium RIFCSPHIGHO2_12_FULL_38_13]